MSKLRLFESTSIIEADDQIYDYETLITKAFNSGYDSHSQLPTNKSYNAKDAIDDGFSKFKIDQNVEDSGLTPDQIASLKSEFEKGFRDAESKSKSTESVTRKSNKRSRTEAFSTEANLSPDMSQLYDNSGAVPKALQMVRKAITQETQAISEYEFMKSTGAFTADQKAVIDEIINDEKDHIVNFTEMLSQLTSQTYPNNGDDAEDDKSKTEELRDSRNKSESKLNKIKLFK